MCLCIVTVSQACAWDFKDFVSPPLNPHSAYSVNIEMALLLIVIDLVAFAVECVASGNVIHLLT